VDVSLVGTKYVVRETIIGFTDGSIWAYHADFVFGNQLSVQIKCQYGFLSSNLSELSLVLRKFVPLGHWRASPKLSDKEQELMVSVFTSGSANVGHIRENWIKLLSFSHITLSATILATDG
jgi:hypothetical protein